MQLGFTQGIRQGFAEIDIQELTLLTDRYQMCGVHLERRKTG
jgi:hypothetical protein